VEGDGNVVIKEVETGANGVGAGLMGDIVDNLIQFVQAAGGELPKRPKVAMPAMDTFGPVSVGGAAKSL